MQGCQQSCSLSYILGRGHYYTGIESTSVSSNPSEWSQLCSFHKISHSRSCIHSSIQDSIFHFRSPMPLSKPVPLIQSDMHAPRHSQLLHPEIIQLLRPNPLLFIGMASHHSCSFHQWLQSQTILCTKASHRPRTSMHLSPVAKNVPIPQWHSTNPMYGDRLEKCRPAFTLSSLPTPINPFPDAIVLPMLWFTANEIARSSLLVALQQCAFF